MSQISDLRQKARQLLESGEVGCVVGYEVSPRGRTRPAFIYAADDVDRLVWSQECTHNLTRYLPARLNPHRPGKDPHKVAVVVKPCDSRAIQVLLAENQFARDQVHIIGVACDGIVEGAGFVGAQTPQGQEPRLQERCLRCTERTPVVSDSFIGQPGEIHAGAQTAGDDLARLEAMTPVERANFWLQQFDRCIRCYACRQACPLCNCPVCLYERDDSLWVGMGIGLNEKRAFHLGRAYHLAGRCVGCDECERVCPMNIPISLLNRKLAQEVQAAFGYRAGLEPTPGPLVTILTEGEVHS
mgnify:CR=1 FL=1